MKPHTVIAFLILITFLVGGALWMGEYLKLLSQVTGEDLRYILTGN